MTRTLANQWDDPPHLDNRLLVILLISFSIFCYKLSIFGNFILQNIEVDLYTETLKLALFWLQNGGRLIHRFDLYTGKYGSAWEAPHTCWNERRGWQLLVLYSFHIAEFSCFFLCYMAFLCNPTFWLVQEIVQKNDSQICPSGPMQKTSTCMSKFRLAPNNFC